MKALVSRLSIRVLSYQRIECKQSLLASVSIVYICLGSREYKTADSVLGFL